MTSVEDILDPTEPGGSAADEMMMADERVTVLEEVVLETEFYEEEPRLNSISRSAFPPVERGSARTSHVLLQV